MRDRVLLSLRRPSDAEVCARLDALRDAPFTYAPVGCTSQPGAPPAGYDRDHAACDLGRGEGAFAAAREAIRAWRPFAIPWLCLLWSDAPLRAGSLVAVLTRRLGLWSLNPCRIVHVIDEPQRFGFAYGTLPGHAERGEELFLATLGDDGVVRCSIDAVSRPAGLLVRCARPYVRRLQARFRRDSCAAMRHAVAATMAAAPRPPLHVATSG